MKEELKSLVTGMSDGKLIAREYLQARILQSLQTNAAMTRLAFHGGTSLRFLFRIPRYSEDLDFSLFQDEGYDFVSLLKKIKGQFNKEGYEVDIRIPKKKSAVDTASIRFPGLLHLLELSPHQEDEVLSIKIEVDANPPAGATFETTIVMRHVALNIHHHDRSTLLAGKLNALLTRGYTKGRDIYDLMWYLSQPEWPEPNLEYLNNALQQFDSNLRVEDWRDSIAERLSLIDWGKAIADVRVFLERQEELEILTRENILKLLG